MISQLLSDYPSPAHCPTGETRGDVATRDRNPRIATHGTQREKIAWVIGSLQSSKERDAVVYACYVRGKHEASKPHV